MADVVYLVANFCIFVIFIFFLGYVTPNFGKTKPFKPKMAVFGMKFVPKKGHISIPCPLKNWVFWKKSKSDDKRKSKIDFLFGKSRSCMILETHVSSISMYKSKLWVCCCHWKARKALYNDKNAIIALILVIWRKNVVNFHQKVVFLCFRRV